jgi:Notch-like protein
MLPRCGNGGVCTDVAATTNKRLYTCDCTGGYSGANCATVVVVPTDCGGTNGFNGGDPIVGGDVAGNAAGKLATSLNVTCEKGYAPNGQTHYVCNKGSWEDRAGGNPAITCDDFNECLSQPCQHGGNCSESASSHYVVAPGDFHCECQDLFSGDMCQATGHVCDSNPCAHGATCTPGTVADKSGKRVYSCKCAKGFSGDNCDVDVNECAPKPCKNGGVCTESNENPAVAFGEFKCQCGPMTGFYGATCASLKVDHCSSQPCKHGGTCVDGTDPSKADSFTCTCKTGTKGETCTEDDDPCAAAPYCLHGGKCNHKKFSGEPTCDCSDTKPKYFGLTCNDNDVCDDPSFKCANLGTCNSTTAACDCPVGWTGKTCDDSDPCAYVVCLHKGTCAAATADATEPDTPASSQAVCACVNGWAGETCESREDICASSPCVHGLSGDTKGCTQIGLVYTCTCAVGYDGSNCDHDVDECASKPCEHGSCGESSTNDKIPFGEYMCECATTGYYGDNCDSNTDDCKSSPCKHGKCADGVNAFTCKCTKGYGSSADLHCDLPPCKTTGGWGDPSWPSSCTLCAPGKKPNAKNDGCETCDAGKYGKESGKCDGTCKTGEEANPDRTACTKCAAGSVSPKGMGCTHCQPGKHQSGLKCINCATGTYSDAVKWGNSSCFTCESGKDPKADQTGCKNCTGVKATWKSNGVCTACGDGKTPALPVRSKCNTCGEGMAGIGGRCNKCPAGKTPGVCADCTPPRIAESSGCN